MLTKNQFERNLEAIQFGQQAQSTYVQPPNPALAFASASLNVANTYYGLEFQKQQAGLLTNAEKRALHGEFKAYWKHTAQKIASDNDIDISRVKDNLELYNAKPQNSSIH